MGKVRFVGRGWREESQLRRAWLKHLASLGRMVATMHGPFVESQVSEHNVRGINPALVTFYEFSGGDRPALAVHFIGGGHISLSGPPAVELYRSLAGTKPAEPAK